MPGLEFINWSISIGNVIELAVILVSIVTFVNKIKTDISLMRQELIHIEKVQSTLSESFVRMGDVLTQVAVQDARISMLERSIDEIKQGQIIK